MNVELSYLARRLDAIEAKLDALTDAPQDPLLWTVEEAAKQCGLSIATMYRMKSVQVRIGSSVRVRPSKLRRYLDRLAPGRRGKLSR